jgi:hypothetical protein
MTDCFLVAASGVQAIAAPGWVLKDTEIDELHVLGLVVLTFSLAGLLIAARPSPKALRRYLGLFSAAALLGLVIFGVVDYPSLRRMCSENNVVEWLTAIFLLVGCVLGWILASRLRRERRVSPLVACAAAVLFAGFCREIEWGRPFFGEKLFYSRNIFQIRAYLSPSYFETLSQRKPLTPEQLLAIHWIATVLLVGLIVVVAVYLVRRRDTFVEELKKLPKTTCGRYLSLGFGLYAASQLLGSNVFDPLVSALFASRTQGGRLSHDVLGEPLECLAALCLMLAIVTLWHAKLGRSAPGEARPVPATERVTVNPSPHAPPAHGKESAISEE